MQLEIHAHLGVTKERAPLDVAVVLSSSRTPSLAHADGPAGRRRLEFQRILARRGIPLAYDAEDFDEHIAIRIELRADSEFAIPAL
jgi:predicted HTH domain antitoxin